jgi:LPXTG-motif cell wall-anchored protein
MKKYVLIGLFAGAAVSLALFFLRRKKQEGLEFHDFVESPAIADDLFGSAFSDLPDKP